MRRFCVFRRKNQKVFYAQIRNPETGKYLPARSTGTSDRSEAYMVVTDWIHNGIPDKNRDDPQSSWLRRFRIIMEHENHLTGKSGGYQEFSHLMLTNAVSKILIGYGEKFENYDAYAFDYQSIMSDLEIDAQPILFLGGKFPYGG